jgi:hypothetical protein
VTACSKLEETTQELRKTSAKLQEEQAKKEALLCEMLPSSVAAELLRGAVPKARQ